MQSLQLFFKDFLPSFKHVRQLSVVLMLGLCLFGFSAPSLAQAQNFNVAPQECRFKDKITIADLVRPAKFFPVIPQACGQEADGSARPLTPAVIPDILLRFFGALASLIFYLFGFIIIFSGIQWSYGGLDGSSTAKAKQNLRDSTLGLVLVAGVYVVVNTILLVLGVQQFNSIDISSFFSFG